MSQAETRSPQKLVSFPAMIFLRFLVFLIATAGLLHANEPEAVLQAKVAAKLTEIKTWAANPVLVEAVVAQNAALPAEYAAMTQERWKALPALDPFVLQFSYNPTGLFLESIQRPWVGEAFVNDARGNKVAFLSKPTTWCHAGKAKHDVPIGGSDWQGPLELDESTGLSEIQIAVPVLKEGVPVGVLIVGISIAEFR